MEYSQPTKITKQILIMRRWWQDISEGDGTFQGSKAVFWIPFIIIIIASIMAILGIQLL